MNYEKFAIRDGFVQIEDSVAELKELIHGHVQGTDAVEDMDYVRHVVRNFDEVEKCEAALGKIREILEGCWSEFAHAVADSSDAVSGLRKIQVEVTQGMINQKYISLTRAKKDGTVRVGERFSIDVGDEVPVKTMLVNPGNKFQNRAFMQSFYEKSKAREGDFVVLQEKTKGTWTMRLKRSEEHLNEFLNTATNNRQKDKL